MMQILLEALQNIVSMDDRSSLKDAQKCAVKALVDMENKLYKEIHKNCVGGPCKKNSEICPDDGSDSTPTLEDLVDDPHLEARLGGDR